MDSISELGAEIGDTRNTAHGAEIGDGAQGKGNAMQFSYKRARDEGRDWKTVAGGQTIYLQRHQDRWYAYDAAGNAHGMGKTRDKAVNEMLALIQPKPVAEPVTEQPVTKEITVTKSPSDHSDAPFEALVFIETCKLVSRTYSAAKRFLLRTAGKAKSK